MFYVRVTLICIRDQPTMPLRGAGFDIADLNDIDERADYDELVAGVST
jgi:hypothetical protein